MSMEPLLFLSIDSIESVPTLFSVPNIGSPAFLLPFKLSSLILPTLVPSNIGH